MARLPRFFVPGAASHVIVRGNDRQDVFTGDGDRLAFLGFLREAAQEHGVAIHAYVLMSNHVHLLATGSEPGSIGRAIQSVGRNYVPRFNRLHERTGTLWEGRHRAAIVESRRYALYCQRYIELNPFRAGLVATPGEYLWSSHLHFAWGKPDDLVTPHEAYESLGQGEQDRWIAYRRLFDSEVPLEVLSEIREAARSGWVVGSPEFCEHVERLTGRRARRRRRRGGDEAPVSRMGSDPIRSLIRAGRARRAAARRGSLAEAG